MVEYGKMESEGMGMNANEALSSAMEAIDLGNLDSVVEEKFVLPASSGVKFIISKAEAKANDSGTWRWVALQLNIVDGILDPMSGEYKYKNKPMFQNVCYYADPVKYNKDYFAKKQHLVQIKSLLNSVGIPLQGVTINSELVDSLVGMEVLANITQQAETAVDTATGKREKTGSMINEVKNFKPCV